MTPIILFVLLFVRLISLLTFVLSQHIVVGVNRLCCESLVVDKAMVVLIEAVLIHAHEAEKLRVLLPTRCVPNPDVLGEDLG